MISAFTADPIIELRQRDKSKIEALLAHGDQLFVGLSSGALRIYRLKDTNGDLTEIHDESPPRTELLKEYEKFSKYKIEQLATFKEANILVSLSGGIVAIHDLGSFELQEQFDKTKGASVFAATSNIVNDPSTGIPSLVSRLAIAVKRRLLIKSWHEGELSNDTQEIALANGIKSLTWASGTKIIAGLQSYYVLVDIQSREVTTIQGPGSIGGSQEQDGGRLGGIGSGTMSYIGMGSMVPQPLATGLGADEMLLARDINSHFITRTGESLSRRQIPWRLAPHAIAYSYPFLLSLHDVSRGHLEVRNPQTLSVLQSVDFSGASLLQVPNPNISLAHQGKGFLVASDRVVWKMKGLKYDDQIQTLVNLEQFDEAISLLNMIEETLIDNKDGRMREIKMQKALRLFAGKRFRESLDLFVEISASPERVIQLYPPAIAGSSASVPSSPTKSHRKNTSVTSTKNSTHGDASSIRSTRTMAGDWTEKELKVATRELQAFLADVRRRLQRFFDSDQMVKDLASVQQSSSVEEVRKVVEDLLGLKKPDQEELDKRLREVATVVDTCLFRAHMLVTPSLAGSLFRIANFCDADVVMSKLEDANRYGDLIEFLYGKRLHRQALEQLQKFGKSKKTEDIDPGLHGPERTVAYLHGLSGDYIDLILEFSKWPLEVNPSLTMEVFVADTANAESLPRQRVLAFLESVDVSLALKYLEHVVDELDDQTPELHQSLINLYFDNILASEATDKSDLIAKLVTMLESSTQYSPAKVLSLLPKDDPSFYEANAVVFSKMGQHKQALQIYVFKLRDFSHAEQYCNQVFAAEVGKKEKLTKARQKILDDASTMEQSSVYHLLLNLYVNPPSGQSALIGPALELMAKHGPRLPASSTLEMIPNELLVKELEFYLRGRVRTANSAVNDARIEIGLRKLETGRLQAALVLGDLSTGIDTYGGKQRKVRVDDERICGVCYKRLGGSVISVFPDNSVVHLGCASRRQNEITAK